MLTAAANSPPPSPAGTANWASYLNQLNEPCEQRGMDPRFCVTLSQASALTIANRGKAPAVGKAVKARVAELKGMRTSEIKGSGKRQPVGAVVSTNIDFTGLRGRTVVLSDHRPRHRGCRLWIPLPKAAGPYFVRSRLALGGTTLATSDSAPFG